MTFPKGRRLGSFSYWSCAGTFAIAFAPSLSANQIIAWGNSSFVPPEANRAVQISAGWGYSLGVSPEGTLLDWGADPGVPPADATNLLAVAASHSHSLALRRDGTVAAWGADYRETRWTAPAGLSNVVAIAANGDADGEQSLALKADGTVVAWGNVDTVPAEATNIVAIAAGGWHELVLKKDGTVIAWGDDTYGQIDVPTDLTNVIAIAAGDFHSLALKNDGTVIGWGWDGEGELDLPMGLTNIVAIAAGTYDSLALAASGQVIGCGATYAPINSGQAVVPPGLTNVIAISAGAGHSLALTIPLQFQTITVANQSTALRFHGFAGQHYMVEYSPDLNNWSPLPEGDLPGTGADITVTDADATSATPARWYRLQQ